MPLGAEERLLVGAAVRVVAQPLTVTTMGQRAHLSACEANEVALADEPFIAEPRQRLGLTSIRPRHDQPPGGSRSGRQFLDRHDARDDRLSHRLTVAPGHRRDDRLLVQLPGGVVQRLSRPSWNFVTAVPV